MLFQIIPKISNKRPNKQYEKEISTKNPRYYGYWYDTYE